MAKKTNKQIAGEWVSRAVSNDVTRYFMNAMYYDAENLNLAATDGWRLHLVKFPSKEFAEEFGISAKGYYNYSKKAGEFEFLSALTNSAQFPNYLRVIPSEGVGTIYTLACNMPEISCPIFCASTGIAVNYNYVKDLLSTKNLTFEARYAEKTKEVRFDAKSGGMEFIAVIMSLKLD